ncbi:MAG: hypothetical protein OXF79_22390 [Chloroflexi bacterium]|nr:hypothetical protein [Chloroflexota bacterium]
MVKMKRVMPTVLDEMEQFAEDRIALEYRRKILLEDNYLYELNKEAALEQPLGHDMTFVAGRVGVGKTTDAIMRARLAFRAGYMVYHNGIGCLFGMEVPDLGIYAFSHSIRRRAHIVIDEAHNFCPSRRSNTIRSQTFLNGLSGRRKNDHRLDLMSSQPRQMDFSVMEQVMWARVPEELSKWARKKSAYGEWCYRKINVLGPYPWRDKNMFEQWGISYYERDVEHREFTALPSQWYDAAAAVNSWANIKKLAGKGVGSEQMWEYLDSADTDEELIVDEYGNEVVGMAEDGTFIVRGPEGQQSSARTAEERAAQDAQVEYENTILTYILMAFRPVIDETGVERPPALNPDPQEKIPVAKIARVIRDHGAPACTESRLRKMLTSYDVRVRGRDETVIVEDIARVYAAYGAWPYPFGDYTPRPPRPPG